MNYILQVDFPYTGPWGNEMTAAMHDLAHSIAEEQGLIWKIWTENIDTKEAGGIYMFDNRADAERYLAMHSARLKAFGIPYVNGKIFAINGELSKIDKAPL